MSYLWIEFQLTGYSQLEQTVGFHSRWFSRWPLKWGPLMSRSTSEVYRTLLWAHTLCMLVIQFESFVESETCNLVFMRMRDRIINRNKKLQFIFNYKKVIDLRTLINNLLLTLCYWFNSCRKTFSRTWNNRFLVQRDIPSGG